MSQSIVAAKTAGEGHSRHRPVIVLTYAHSGSDLLMQILSASPVLACTSTDLLSLCHTAAASWQRAENRSGLSALAVKAIRQLVITMMTTVQASTGASRLCELAVTSPAEGATFSRIFPEAAFVCLHRSLRGVLSETIISHPWGLGGSPFWQYAGGHPGNNAATIAAYWAASAEQLIEFEEQHSASCMRVKYEDINGELGQQTADLFAFLELDSPDPALPHHPGVRSRISADADIASTLPVRKIPSLLLAQVSALHTTLGYAAPA